MLYHLLGKNIFRIDQDVMVVVVILHTGAGDRTVDNQKGVAEYLCSPSCAVRIKKNDGSRR